MIDGIRKEVVRMEFRLKDVYKRQGGDPLFENGGGRIGQAGIDIAELAQRKAIGTILRIVEHIGCSLVNGYGTGTGNRIGYLSGVDLQRVEAVILDVYKRQIPEHAAGRQNQSA